MKLLNKLSDFLGKYFIVLVLLMVVAAMALPQAFIALGRTRVFGQSLVTVGLGLIMFVMGLTLNEKDFKVIVTRPKDVFIGCLAQFTVMPFMAYFLAKTLRLPPELAVGLVLLGTCLGGTASNVMTYLAKGDVALSIGMTTVSTLAAPILTPALTYFLAGQWVEINMYAMLLDIVKVVIVPIFLGMAVHKAFGEKVHKVSKVLVIIPIVCILMIMGLCVAPNKMNLINSGAVLIMAVCLHNWFGSILGYAIGMLSLIHI